jgi:hypothetical protein
MGVKSYRKKPVVIQAIQSTFENLGDVMAFVGVHVVDQVDGQIFIETKEGRMHISDGDYVIRGVKGEFYPCKPDIFAASYDEEV